MTDTYSADANGKLTILKDPDATLDYSFDWTEYLAAMLEDGVPAAPDTITTGVCTLVSSNGTTNAQVEQTDVDGNIVTGWVSGGATGETLQLKCTINTTGGRTEIRSVYLKIKAR
jgi:hypothetical protein